MSLHHTQDAACPLCAEKLKDAHPDIDAAFTKIKEWFPDAHISWTFRNEEMQNHFFAEGKTRCKWPNSAHNKRPSRAMDLFQLRKDGLAAWPKVFFAQIAEHLKASGFDLEWGGNWKTIGDGDHFELKKEGV